MRPSALAALILAGSLSLTALPGLAAAQGQTATRSAYKPPRLSDGKPDLTGAWTNGSLTALQRQAAHGDRLVLSEEEAAKIEGEELKAAQAGNAPTDPSFTINDLPFDCGRGFSGANCGYNSGWVDPGSTVMRVNGQPRSSFITTTPNGRIPPPKADAPRPTGPRLPPGVGAVDNPETRALGERCLMSFGQSTGPIMQPQLYNNNYMFAQSKDSLAIWVEMVHDVRVIRIGAKHRTDGVRPWMGDSIGWWEGDTLVAETTNFHPRQSIGLSSANLKVTERFTRVAPDRILYQFKVEDPTVWDQPWGGEYEFAASSGQVYEYACHEGNYALEGILAGARAEEALAASRNAAAPAPPAN